MEGHVLAKPSLARQPGQAGRVCCGRHSSSDLRARPSLALKRKGRVKSKIFKFVTWCYTASRWALHLRRSAGSPPPQKKQGRVHRGGSDVRHGCGWAALLMHKTNWQTWVRHRCSTRCALRMPNTNRVRMPETIRKTWRRIGGSECGMGTAALRALRGGEGRAVQRKHTGAVPIWKAALRV